MFKNPSVKYQRFDPVSLPNRRWPSQTITKAPIWCSVDLRDGNQALAVPMNVSQKLDMFDALVKCGFKEIEVGFPSASNTEFSFNRRLIEEGRIPDDVTIQCLVQAREDLIEKTVQSLIGAKKVVIHMYNSTSPAQRKYVFGKSKEEIIAVAVKGAQMIKDRLHRLTAGGTHVTLQYSPESFSATEVEFAKDISEAVMDVWQPTPQHKMILNLPDTVEVCMPNVYADQIEWICTNIKNRESLIVSLHTHNDRGTGTAATELGLLAGADRVEGTLFGNGERTGNLDIVQVAMNLYMHGLDPKLDFSDMNGLIQMYERTTGMTVPPRQPYAGELVFTAFSGSHQDAIKKGLTGYEQHKTIWDVPYLTIDPRDIGREYHEVIRVNSQSGKGGVAYLLESEFGIELPKDMQREFGIVASEEVDRLGREVTGAELKQMFDAEYLDRREPWRLVDYSIRSADGKRICDAVIEEFGAKREVSGSSGGALSAFADALKQLLEVGLHTFEIAGFHEDTMSFGSDAQAVAFVKIKFGDDQMAWGVAMSQDATKAQFEALLNALNGSYPWISYERRTSVVLPLRLRFDFARHARLCMRRAKALYDGADLETLFRSAFHDTLPIVHVIDYDFGVSQAGKATCTLELDLSGAIRRVTMEGSNRANACLAALCSAMQVQADIIDLHVTRGEAIKDRRGAEFVAFAQVRFASGRTSWGAGIAAGSNIAMVHSIASAMSRHLPQKEEPQSILKMHKTKAEPAYPFPQIEPSWQRQWEKEAAFRTPNPGDADFDAEKPKYYVLDMFPYPSGAGLHVGHPEGYTATDIIGRFKKMSGFNVLHPMGWDAFGLPAEQYAIKSGQHPSITTQQNVDRFREQLKSLGFAYDWHREVNTTEPGYFKWTQWIFLKLYNSYVGEDGKAHPVSELESSGFSQDEIDAKRLAYVCEAPVNWCPSLGTVLANEEVIEGKSEVGGHPVERRPMRQWMLRITAYAQRLIDELDGLDWPESIKLLQRNWIGRSEGAEVTFKVQGFEETITVFTTRPDTLFGATYMVLAPEHRLVDVVTSHGQSADVAKYREKTARKSDLERTELAKEKSGVFTGAYAINPVNNEQIPIWIADYVLMGYGTGAIMAVPAHDERDYEFAQMFGLPIKQVVQPLGDLDWRGYTDYGTAVNSGFLDGLSTQEAKQHMTVWLQENGCGQGTVNYKLRDWLFSRQRYWGEPFPIVWEEGRHRAIPESELPLLPPDLADFKPTGTPEPPLSKATDWVQYSATAKREVNTMPQWAGSCWYYLRYCDALNHERFVGEAAEKYWMGGGNPGGVDLYVGGTEHAVLHLLYARFWHKVLFDLGYISTPEPFQRLVNQGLIMGADGQKMSKSRGNVVNPDDVIQEFGADSLRLYEMFMGPLEQVKSWNMKGVEGVHRFLARVWRLVMESDDKGSWTVSSALQDVSPDRQLTKALHETIKKCGDDIEKLSFNTAISQMMVCTNAYTAAAVKPASAIVTFLKVLSPFAPHLAEELNAQVRSRFPSLAAKRFLSDEAWPAYDPGALVDDEVEVVFQVNGKLRDKALVPAAATKEDIQGLALASPRVQEFMDGKPVKKIIVVPGKLVNVVV